MFSSEIGNYVAMQRLCACARVEDHRTSSPTNRDGVRLSTLAVGRGDKQYCNMRLKNLKMNGEESGLVYTPEPKCYL